MKVNEFNWKVSRAHGRIYTQTTGRGETYLTGEVLTPHGIVSVYSQGDEHSSPSSNFQFVWAGRCYSRSRNQRLSKRGLVTLADRFAREIVEGTHG